ncbi:MAG: hypothetical protein OEU49_01995 [Chromatiales bacterium]|jgi:hypothetical protein|nr:hypothetical protein [Chromatiales bacterium]MDH4029596.1 hypothetical protein [Chromatiales bacterium]
MSPNPNIIDTELSPAAGRGPSYAIQRVYAGFMMWLISRLLQAASAVDPVIKKDIDRLPEDFSFSMRVRSGSPALAMRKMGDDLRAVQPSALQRPALVFEFKHVAHAFLVMSFQESTPRAFANDRLAVDGDFACAMKIMRSLNRMQALVLPRFIAVRALKAYPPIGIVEKLGLAARIYGRLVIDLFKRDPS